MALRGWQSLCKAAFSGIACMCFGWLAYTSVSTALAAPPVEVKAEPKKDAEPEKIPDPEDIVLTTSDGMELKGTFFASTKGKNAVPVLMLSGSKGDHKEYASLALHLQRLGHAVLAIDLRGYGESVRYKDPQSGQSGTLDPKTMRASDYGAMIKYDVEAAKSFLMKKNNAGDLNIEKLCVIGAEMSVVVALNWAAVDWSWPVLSTGKQGQDVKALILISPEWTFKSLRINEAITHPDLRSQLSLMLVTSKAGKSVAETKRLADAFKKYHPEPPPEERVEKKDFFVVNAPTVLQGTKMLEEKSLKLDEQIAQFIDLRLVHKTFNWAARKSPLD